MNKEHENMKEWMQNYVLHNFPFAINFISIIFIITYYSFLPHNIGARDVIKSTPFQIYTYWQYSHTIVCWTVAHITHTHKRIWNIKYIKVSLWTFVRYVVCNLVAECNSSKYLYTCCIIKLEKTFALCTDIHSYTVQYYIHLRRLTKHILNVYTSMYA